MRILITCCLLLMNIAICAADRLDAQVLTSVKDATVFLKTKSGSGSGFLLRNSGKDGLIATNAHVVAESILNKDLVTAVFGSGTKNELTFSAIVIGVDLQRDLAFLRITSEKLPKPLTLATKTKVDETMTVWVIGFPFGEALALGTASPSPTITPTQVSSLRKDPFGNIEIIQTSGGINPGNSGGPIINNRGAVVGIAVAKVIGADIGFGIPVASLEEDLAGRAVSADPVVTVDGERMVEVDVTLTCVDPLASIAKATILVAPAAKAPDKPKTDDKGRVSGPLMSGMNDQVLEYANQEGKGKVKFKLPKDATPNVVVQFKLQRKDGSTIFTEVLRAAPGDRRTRNDVASQKNADAGITGTPQTPLVAFTFEPPKVTPVTPDPERAVPVSIERDSRGQSVQIVNSNGALPYLGKGVLQVVAHPTGKQIYMIRAGESFISVIDPRNWTTITEILVPEFPTSLWADSQLIGVACGKSKSVVLIDCEKHSVIASGVLPKPEGLVPEKIVGRAPDGAIMSIWKPEGDNSPDRLLVHTTTEGMTKVMLADSNLHWATWLPSGAGVVGQSPFFTYPYGILDPVYPKTNGTIELHGKRLMGGQASFNTDTGRAFLTSDRKSLVWRRQKVDPSSTGQPEPWTYLISPEFDTVQKEFPGSAFVELAEQRTFISLGHGLISGNRVPMCYYIDSQSGQITRRVNLLPPQGLAIADLLRRLGQVEHQAVFIPGQEILMVPFAVTGEAPGIFAYVTFRCGPISTAATKRDSLAINDPPATAMVGSEASFTPQIPDGSMAKDFRLKFPLHGMSVDAKNGTWTWRPAKEHVGHWPVSIVATIDDKTVDVLIWTIEVK